MNYVEARQALVDELSNATEQAAHAERIFAQPYSSDYARIDMFSARGRCRGIARAIEILDALQET